MRDRLYLSLLVLLIGIGFACSKPVAPQTEFDVSKSSREAFSALVNQLSSQGVSFTSLDNGGMTFSTGWKEIDSAELRQIALLSAEELRYERGRYRLDVQVTEASSGAHVKIDATVEGLFQGKQSGTSGTGREGWSAEPTTGALEKSLVEQLL